jgi:hypothetical protein
MSTGLAWQESEDKDIDKKTNMNRKITLNIERLKLKDAN